MTARALCTSTPAHPSSASRNLAWPSPAGTNWCALLQCAVCAAARFSVSTTVRLRPSRASPPRHHAAHGGGRPPQSTACARKEDGRGREVCRREATCHRRTRASARLWCERFDPKSRVEDSIAGRRQSSTADLAGARPHRCDSLSRSRSLCLGHSLSISTALGSRLFRLPFPIPRSAHPSPNRPYMATCSTRV